MRNGSAWRTSRNCRLSADVHSPSAAAHSAAMPAIGIASSAVAWNGTRMTTMRTISKADAIAQSTTAVRMLASGTITRGK